MALRSKQSLSVFLAGLMLSAAVSSLSADDPSPAGVVRIRDGVSPFVSPAGSVRPAGHNDGPPLIWNAYETTGQKIIYRMRPVTGNNVGWEEEVSGRADGWHPSGFGEGCPDGVCENPEDHESLPGHIIKHFFPDVRGRGGHGLFGGNCRLNPYESQCEDTAWFRHWHAKSCRWNRYWYGVYQRDGAGAGKYDIYYPLNLQHFDSRDGRIYAAPEWGIPMAVPLAPTVEHTYNYGWGVPSSRLTRMSYPVPRTGP